MICHNQCISRGWNVYIVIIIRWAARVINCPIGGHVLFDMMWPDSSEFLTFWHGPDIQYRCKRPTTCSRVHIALNYWYSGPSSCVDNNVEYKVPRTCDPADWMYIIRSTALAVLVWLSAYRLIACHSSICAIQIWEQTNWSIRFELYVYLAT